MGWRDSHFVKDKFDRRYGYNVTLTNFLGRDMVWILRHAERPLWVQRTPPKNAPGKSIQGLAAARFCIWRGKARRLLTGSGPRSAACTLSLSRALRAGKMFDKLDKDGDGTLNSKEVGTRVTKTDFKAADADHDGTLTKDEYFTIVEKLFNGADVDQDGALSAQELQSKAGRALLRQLQ